MGLRAALAKLAAGAPVPVFAIAGVGGREAMQELRVRDELQFARTPRAASILLVLGRLPERLAGPLARAHDQMPPPRCLVWWPLGASTVVPEVLRAAVQIGGEPVAALQRLHRELLSGARQSQPPFAPDTEAVPWRGVGPYGQGGGGMTGGTPYGRPLAGLVPDRDELRLDALPLRIGPFFPSFPPGLLLHADLSGDVVLDVSVGPNPFLEDVPLSAVRPGLRPFLRALAEPVSVAELELARAREHLRWLADALAAIELQALARRVVRLVPELRPGDTEDVRRLARVLIWSQALGWATRGVGQIPRERLDELGLGPVARAAGLPEDERTDDPAYRALGFEPVLHEDGDAAARWRQRLAEAEQSLRLARDAGDRSTEPRGVVESPRGRLESASAPTGRLLALIPELLGGLEWGDAVTSLASLDLDLEEMAAVERPGVEVATT